MSLILPRRGFLLGLGSLLAAPAIVRIQNIMPVKSMPAADVLDAGLDMLDGVPELVLYDSEGNVLHRAEAPSLPLNADIVNHIYKSPALTFDVPRTCVVSHVELRHPKYGAMQVSLAGGRPKYVTVGQTAVLDPFDVKLL